jgi:integrase
MAKSRKYCIDPRTHKQVDGVSYHASDGYYIRVNGKRQAFGRGLAALDKARDAYAASIYDSPLARHYRKIGAPQELIDMLAKYEWRDEPVTTPQTVLPGGPLNVADVGAIYRDWYTRELQGIDRADCEARAKVHNETLTKAHREALATAPRVGGFRASADQPVNVKNRKRRRPRLVTWLHFAPRHVRKRVYEHTRYYDEFVAFIGADVPIERLTGSHLVSYKNHVKAQAREKAKPKPKSKPLTKPDLWACKRFEVVTTAFRRAKKERPDANWPQGFFGTDGHLAILEQTGAVVEARKTILTREQFQALVDVADTQWKALLYLTANCGLENESVSALEWRHVHNGLMVFPRPKNGRQRQTPLAPQTIAALKAWRKECPTPDGRIFSTEHGTPLLGGTDNVAKGYDRLRALLKAKGYVLAATFKSLRKTASSLTFTATDGNETAVKMMLGQAPASAWKHYVMVAPDFLHKAVKTIEKELFVKKGSSGKSGVR